MSEKFIKKHIQYKDGSYDIEEVSITNEKRLEEIRIHNKMVRKYIYETKKIISIYSIEQIEEMTGQELASEELSPLEKLILMAEGDYYENKKNKFEEGLTILSDAMSTLTENQKMIFQSVIIEGKSRRQIAKEIGVSHTAVNSSYNRALNKLRKFFSSQSEYFLYFPKIKKECDKYD